MSAANVSLTIEQGATFTLIFTWYHDSLTTPGTPGDPVDLTGAELRMQIRKNQQSPVLAEATSTGASPKITHGGTNGTVTVKLGATDTNALTSKSALYDLEAVMPNGDVHRVVSGTVTVSPNITQIGGEPVVTT